MEDSPPLCFSGSETDSDNGSNENKKITLKKVQIPGASKNGSPQGLYEKIRAKNIIEIQKAKMKVIEAYVQYKSSIGLIDSCKGIVIVFFLIK